MLSIFVMGLMLSIFVISSTAFAQPTASDIQEQRRNADQIIREEQLRQQHILREQELRRRPPGKVDSGVDKLPPAAAEPGECFEIRTIILEGANRLKESEKRQITEPFVGKCIGLGEIRELMRVLTNFFIDKGYVTTRVYIPQQDMGSGVLRLTVIEGIVEKFELDSDKARIGLGTAFPGIEGQVLNIRDIEQGLDQINRLQSNGATMELVPAQTPGKTRIVIKNSPRNPLSGSFSVDNQGSESQGKYRGTATLGVDNPLGLNDYWFGSFNHNIDNDSGNGLSTNRLGSFNIPYGYWTLSGSYSHFVYKNLIRSATQNFQGTGNATTTNLGVSKVLDRGQTYKLTFASGLTRKVNENFIEQSLLTTSSRRLTILNANLTAVFPALAGNWTLDAGLAKGTGLLGVDEFPGAGTGTVPTAKFLKAEASASYSLPFQLDGVDLSWTSSLQGQYAKDYLLGSEQISVGGWFTVRGYEGTSIAGDRGAYWRNEIALTVARSSDKTVAKWIGSVQPYLAIDAGRISPRDGQPGGALSGAAIGIRNRGGLINFDIAYGEPLRYPGYLDAGSGVKKSAVFIKVGIAL